jgi:hypothetical protein
MPGEEISIDELLEKQTSSPAIRATVEGIEGDESRVAPGQIKSERPPSFWEEWDRQSRKP